jgi:hypothetical protein
MSGPSPTELPKCGSSIPAQMEYTCVALTQLIKYPKGFRASTTTSVPHSAGIPPAKSTCTSSSGPGTGSTHTPAASSSSSTLIAISMCCTPST